MCNSKISMTSLTFPASEALERASKRPRTCSPLSSPAQALDLASVFDAIDTDFTFPTIAWDFDDEEAELEANKEVIAMPSLGKKRDCNGLVRSKSFKTSLSALSSDAVSSLSMNRAISSEPNKNILNTLASETLKASFKLDGFPIYEKREPQLLKLSFKSSLPSLYKAEEARCMATLV
jgi:hypothetical protein